MDIHLVPGAEPTAAEREALDDVLGAAVDGWDGGERARRASGQHRQHRPCRARAAPPAAAGALGAAGADRLDQPRRAQRALPPAHDPAGRRLRRRHLLRACSRVEPRPPRVVHVCEDVACRCSGSDELIAPARGALRAARASSRTTARRPGTAAPASASATVLPRRSSATRARAATSGRSRPRPPRRARGARRRRARRGAGDRAAAGRRPVAAAAAPRRRRSAPATLDAYRAHGGYEALAPRARARARGRDPRAEGLEAAGPRRRRVPDRRKWEAVARQPARPHYLVCNADESEPGTFKDRVLLERDPFALIEAMTIAAYATGCERGYLYIRGEYPRAAARARARDRGGARAAACSATTSWARAFAFDIEIRTRRGRVHLRRGDGDLQLDRGQPRRAAQQAAVPRRRRACSASRRSSTTSRRSSTCSTSCSAAGRRTPSAGTEASTGTKLFCLSGHVERPGVYEVPFGTTLRELLDLAGGVAGGQRAAGGAAGRRRGRLPAARRARPAADVRGRPRRRGRRSARAS